MPSVTSVFYPNQQNVFYFINQVCLHGMCTWSFTTKASECCIWPAPIPATTLIATAVLPNRQANIDTGSSCAADVWPWAGCPGARWPCSATKHSRSVISLLISYFFIRWYVIYRTCRYYAICNYANHYILEKSMISYTMSRIWGHNVHREISYLGKYKMSYTRSKWLCGGGCKPSMGSSHLGKISW